MSYDLFIGDKGFSSWSLRGWLLFEKFNIPYREHMMGLYISTMKQDLASLAPARFVPTVRTPEGWVIGESIALAETLAERYPDAGFWPADPRSAYFCTLGSWPKCMPVSRRCEALARCHCSINTKAFKSQMRFNPISIDWKSCLDMPLISFPPKGRGFSAITLPPTRFTPLWRRASRVMIYLFPSASPPTWLPILTIQLLRRGAQTGSNTATIGCPMRWVFRKATGRLKATGRFLTKTDLIPAALTLS